MGRLRNCRDTLLHGCILCRWKALKALEYRT